MIIVITIYGMWYLTLDALISYPIRYYRVRINLYGHSHNVYSVYNINT